MSFKPIFPPSSSTILLLHKVTLLLKLKNHTKIFYSSEISSKNSCHIHSIFIHIYLRLNIFNFMCCLTFVCFGISLGYSKGPSCPYLMPINLCLPAVHTSFSLSLSLCLFGVVFCLACTPSVRLVVASLRLAQ